MKNEIYYYEKINLTIQLLLSDFERGGKRLKIAIYPFGFVGQLTKKVLNDVYNIKEDYIFDAQISKFNNKIKNINNYDKNELKDTAVIVASDKLSIYDEIRQNCAKVFLTENIYDILDKVCIDRDVRIETLRLNAERIKELGVKGSVAELGVYKGYFSREINRYFSDRTLYMFDTFEGFLNDRLHENVDSKFESYMELIKLYFVTDNFSSILHGFKNPKKCVIKKGFFPETTIGIEDTYCFVSIDVDIYTSTKAGLDYFWPRMEKHGIIMVHDYNNYYTRGVKEAVDEFAELNYIPIVMVADIAGSAILIKY